LSFNAALACSNALEVAGLDEPPNLLKMLLDAGLGVILRGFISNEGPDLGTGLEPPEGSTGLGADCEGL